MVGRDVNTNMSNILVEALKTTSHANVYESPTSHANVYESRVSIVKATPPMLLNHPTAQYRQGANDFLLRLVLKPDSFRPSTPPKVLDVDLPKHIIYNFNILTVFTHNKKGI